MKASIDHIATSHVGSLPRPDGLIAVHRAHEAGEPIDEAAFQQTLRAAVAEVVRRQRDIGIDIPGDGEFGKPMAQRVQYGSWWRYSWQRLGGLDFPRAQPVRHDAATVPPRRGRADELRRPPGSQPVRRRLRRSRVRHHHRAARAGAGLRRADHLYRPRCDRGRHRQFQGGDAGGRGRGGFHDLGRPGQRLAHRQRVLQDRGGTAVRLRRCDARGIPGDRRGGAGSAARRSGDRRELGHGQPGADGGRLPAVLDGARRGAQPRDPRAAAGPHPVPPVLGKLARSAHDGHPDAGHRRGHAGDQRPCVFVRGRQCAPRA